MIGGLPVAWIAMAAAHSEMSEHMSNSVVITQDASDAADTFVAGKASYALFSISLEHVKIDLIHLEKQR